MSAVREVQLPALHELEPEPRVAPETYERRLVGLRRRMAVHGLEAVLVYADREHFANSAYLLGFDPRFEEALVVVGRDLEPTIVTGNESLALTGDCPVPVRGVLCQAFSLPSQDRSRQPRLADALREAGIDSSQRVGVIGWKAIPPTDSRAEPSLAVPQFVLAEIADVLGEPPVDATALLCGEDGLRNLNEADQLAVHEHRATRASQCVWRAIEALRPGVSELDVSVAMALPGLPLSCHVMCTSGRGSVNGLRSPTDRRLEAGDCFSTAVGFWGGLCARAGLVVDADDPRVDEFVERFAGPYFGAVRAWYAELGVDVDAGRVVEAVRRALNGSGVELLVNPGHRIQLDEWVNSPFVDGASQPLPSGTALQCDLIPVSQAHPGFAANVEDSLALADGDLRAELAERFPRMWERVQARRRFMAEALGLELADCVLPFSDRQGVLPAALLTPTHAVAA